MVISFKQRSKTAAPVLLADSRTIDCMNGQLPALSVSEPLATNWPIAELPDTTVKLSGLPLQKQIS